MVYNIFHEICAEKSKCLLVAKDETKLEAKQKMRVIPRTADLV